MTRTKPPAAGPSRIGRLLPIAALAAWVVATEVRADAPATGKTGAAIYRAQCASCHGPAGEGTDDYPRALEGDRSVPQLARLIARTMPEDDPGTCVGEDAEKVAAFIHGSFYSKAARARLAPARVELSRLTVRQYRNAAADLVGAFRAPAAWGKERGLRGHYFKGRGFNGDARVLDRLDPGVRFDFGTASPEPEVFEADEFTIRWEGSVLAPDTGEYTFTVRTEHAARLWVNGAGRPLIDAWVKSGKDTEFKASIPLLGGRAYPVKLEFSKAKQGVNDDPKKKKRRPAVPASIALEWTPPQGVAQPVPARNLSPERSPEVFVSTAPFPADDRSAGYERGTSVSKAWDQATTDAALEASAYVGSRLRDLAGVGDSAPDRPAKLREFARKFAERAFRRPLTPEQVALYVERPFATAPDPETGVRRAVLMALKSPRFLYREPGGRPDAYDVAARVAFALWDSLPDKELLDAAASGRLATRAQVSAQATRMAGDLRARAKVREFLLQWLRVETPPDLSKDPAAYPGFDAAVAADLRTSLDLFLEDVVWGESSDYRRLLLADAVPLNGRLAKVYGVDLPDDAGFRPVALEPRERAGVLTHPYLLSTFAYTASGSPIHRGVFVARSVLGRSLKPPPEAVAPLAPDLHAGLTTRQRVELQTRPAACITCHGMINPLGFAMEHFDAVGRFRDREKGQAVDASGAYEPPDGSPSAFTGARGLATALAAGDEAPTAFVEQLFHYLVKQPVPAFGPRTLPDLRRSFAAEGFHIRKLLVEIATTSALAAPDESTAGR